MLFSSKACRCYEKAYKLGADDNEAGIALVDCLSSLGEHVSKRYSRGSKRYSSGSKLYSSGSKL